MPAIERLQTQSPSSQTMQKSQGATPEKPARMRTESPISSEEDEPATLDPPSREAQEAGDHLAEKRSTAATAREDPSNEKAVSEFVATVISQTSEVPAASAVLEQHVKQVGSDVEAGKHNGESALSKDVSSAVHPEGMTERHVKDDIGISSTDVRKSAPSDVSRSSTLAVKQQNTEQDSSEDAEGYKLTFDERDKLDLPHENVASKFVDTVISDVAFAHGVSAERSRVQNIISNLVEKVSRASAENADSKGESGYDPKATLSGANSEVPYGDQRAWCVATSAAEHDLASKDQLDLHWSQTTDTVSVTLVLHTDQPASAREVKVDFGMSSVAISVRGNQILNERLTHDIEVDSTMWSLDRTKSDSPSLILELEKSRGLWWPVLFESHHPASYTLYHPRSPAREISKTTSQTQSLENSGEKSSIPTFASDTCEEHDSSMGQVTEDLSQSEPERETPANSSKRVRSDVPIRADISKVVEQYRKAFEEGGREAPEAALQLAAFYHHGIGVKKDDAHAARLYRYALERGVLDSSAAFQLGLLYNQGCDGLNVDAEEAVRWWTVSAKLGNPVAYFNLGVMYMNGSGCRMDPNRAMTFFDRAHAMNPQLRPPMFSSAQLTERMAQAARLKKLKQKTELSDEDKQRRLTEAKEMLRLTLYGAGTVLAVGFTAVLIRNWWRNRL